MTWPKHGFGLGYYDGPNGELSHYLWFEADNMDSGPYRVKWSVFRTVTEFRELAAEAGLAVVASGLQPSGRFLVECRPT